MKRFAISLVTACLVVVPAFESGLSIGFIGTANAIGNGNGNGGGNSNSGGNGGSKSESSQSNKDRDNKDRSDKTGPKVKTTSDKVKVRKAAAVEKAKVESRKVAALKPVKAERILAKAEKKSAHSVGALNALHASPKAFANAAPNSRLGKIKAYYMASLEAQTASADIVAAQTNLATQQALLTTAQGELQLLVDSVLSTTLLREAADTELLAAQDALALLAEGDEGFDLATERLTNAEGALMIASDNETLAIAARDAVSLVEEQQAVTDANTLLENAQTAANQQSSEADALLLIASNKLLDADQRATLDALLAAKFGTITAVQN